MKLVSFDTLTVTTEASSQMKWKDFHCNTACDCGQLVYRYVIVEEKWQGVGRNSLH